LGEDVVHGIGMAIDMVHTQMKTMRDSYGNEEHDATAEVAELVDGETEDVNNAQGQSMAQADQEYQQMTKKSPPNPEHVLSGDEDSGGGMSFAEMGKVLSGDEDSGGGMSFAEMGKVSGEG
jgi:hypothetical protein